MSHTSTVSTIKIQSVTALRAAVAELNSQGIACTLVEGATPRAYFSDQPGLGKADFVLALPEARYDVGLYKVDGGYEARTDFYAGSVAACLGAPARSEETRGQAQMGKLFQAYGIHAAMEAARKKGHMVRRINKQDGTVALEITGPNL